MRTRRPPPRRDRRCSTLGSLLGWLLVVPASAAALGCHPVRAVAPTYGASANAPIADAQLPVAMAHYVFSRPRSPGRAQLAKPLADRFLVRARRLVAQGREKPGLAAVRFAAHLLRVNGDSAESISDEGAAALDVAVQGPAARGEEGVAIGMYVFWSLARPRDPRPRAHLDSLGAWTSSMPSEGSSAIVAVGREATRRADALAYAPLASDRAPADAAMFRWMDQVVAFKEGERTPGHYGDEVYAAVTGFHTAGLRLVAGHLRDGDIAGAAELVAKPQTEGFVPEPLRRALVDAGVGSALTDRAYQQVIAALVPALKTEGAEDAVADAILGTALAATPQHPRSEVLAEIAARGILSAGGGDAAPAILARALLGTEDEPRRPPAQDLGRALTITSAAIRDYADREEFDDARRTYASAGPLLLAADEVGGVEPPGGDVKSLMGVIEGEAGRPAAARALFEEAIAVAPLGKALAGRARLEAREGRLAAARADVTRALSARGLGGDPPLHAELLTLAADLSRRAGDVEGARGQYEAALRLLLPLRARTRGALAAEIGRRIARILARFSDAAEKEEDAETLAESAASGDPRALGRMVWTRFLRPLRTIDGKLARSAFLRAIDVAIPEQELVKAAVLARAIARRAHTSIDTEVSRVIASAASRDDFVGDLARFATKKHDAVALLAKAKDPRKSLAARFVVAMDAWGEGGTKLAAKPLDEVARADVLDTIEVELALELLEPERAAIGGTVTPKKVAGF